MSRSGRRARTPAPASSTTSAAGARTSSRHPTPSPPIGFYLQWLGWEVEKAGDGYWSVENAGADNGGLLAPEGPPAWLVYFHVEDADPAARSAAAAGAVVLLAPETIGLGRIAILADPQGAAFGLFAGPTDP